MKIATVNVNGVRAAMRKGMGPWLSSVDADVVCLQEVRAPDEIVHDFFSDEWNVVAHASEIKGRSGVALLARGEVHDVAVGSEALGTVAEAATHTGRWLEATVATPVGNVRVVSVYVHSGEAGTPKMDDKYEFLDLMTARMKNLSQGYERVVVMGDINTAHTERDIKNWKGNLASAGFLPEERAYLDRWYADGWVDVHRLLEGDRDGPYTWWSMRGKAFDNDAGWRIDLQVANDVMAQAATSAQVDRADSWGERWSDHAPLVVDYVL